MARDDLAHDSIDTLGQSEGGDFVSVHHRFDPVSYRHEALVVAGRHAHVEEPVVATRTVLEALGFELPVTNL